jgi:hypothetical protein
VYFGKLFKNDVLRDFSGFNYTAVVISSVAKKYILNLNPLT